MVNVIATAFDWQREPPQISRKSPRPSRMLPLTAYDSTTTRRARNHHQCHLRRTTDVGFRSGGGTAKNQGQVLLQQGTRLQFSHRHDEVSGRCRRTTQLPGGDNARKQRNCQHGQPRHRAAAAAGVATTIRLRLHRPQ